MTHLEPMSAAEVQESIERGIVRVAGENVARGLWSKEAAVTTSRSEFNELLPQGGETPGFSFLKMIDERSGRRVGETWFSVRRKGGRTHFWVHWIQVEPAFRRRGHARSTLEQLTERASLAGADRVGLYVLADNRPARALYSKLGYAPTGLRLARAVELPRAAGALVDARRRGRVTRALSPRPERGRSMGPRRSPGARLK